MKSNAPLKLTKPVIVPVELKGILVAFMKVTPDIAKKWLKHNVHNRRMIEDTANAYARDIRSDHWRLTHQGIAFNDENELIDGQHRLEGIIRAGNAAIVMVTTGLPKEPDKDGGSIMDAVDRGVSRSVANVLLLQHGIQKSGTMAATATVIGNLCYRGRLRKATVPQIVAIMGLYREHMEWIVERRLDYSTPQLRAANVLGAIAFARAVHREETEEFYSDFSLGRNDDSPSEQARHFLLSHDAMRISNGGSGGRVVLAEVLLNALYNVIHKRHVKLVHTDQGVKYFQSRQQENAEKVRELFELETYHRGNPKDELPAPTQREIEYQRLRSEMGINSPAEEEHCPMR